MIKVVSGYCSQEANLSRFDVTMCLISPKAKLHHPYCLLVTIKDNKMIIKERTARDSLKDLVVYAHGRIARVRRRMKGLSPRDGECLGKISARQQDVLSLKEHAGHKETWDRGTCRCSPIHLHRMEHRALFWRLMGARDWKEKRSIWFASLRQLVCTETKQIMNIHKRNPCLMQGTPKKLYLHS